MKATKKENQLNNFIYIKIINFCFKLKQKLTKDGKNMQQKL